MQTERPSKLWYLLPIFLGIIGGVIGYFALRNKDKKFAEKLLIAGVIVTVISIFLSFILGGISYMYLNRAFRSNTYSVIAVIDSTCIDGTHSFTIRNMGTEEIDTNDLLVTIDDEAVNCSWSGSLSPGGSAICTTAESSPPGSYTFRIVGNSNTASGLSLCV